MRLVVFSKSIFDATYCTTTFYHFIDDWKTISLHLAVLTQLLVVSSFLPSFITSFYWGTLQEYHHFVTVVFLRRKIRVTVDSLHRFWAKATNFYYALFVQCKTLSNQHGFSFVFIYFLN